MDIAYELQDIKYFYDKTPALCLDKLTIQAHKSTALIGPNGCGKSTLLHLLAFLQKNQQGRIQFFSTPADKQQIPGFVKRIAFLPQKPYLLRGTVADNLNLTLKFHGMKKRYRQMKVALALEHFNCADLLNLQAKSLSGGEQQKVALARVLINQPDVLLMDEPFSYLDQASEQLVQQFIHFFVKENNKTLVFSTHNRLQGMAIADNVISLVKGQLVNGPLLNLFHGSSDKQRFNTGNIVVTLAETDQEYQHISIDPGEIVLSREPLVSSMRNQYQGKVTGITDELGKICVTVAAGEVFQVLITLQAMQQLDISIGEGLWVNFKSNSILAF